MADNIWDNSDADFDGNVAANWSLGNVPAGTDVAVFDSGTTDANCTFSGNISCAGMRFDNAYAGTVDGATHDFTLGASGLDCTGGGAATLDLGSGTWTVTDGDFDYGDIGTLDDGTSTVVLTGTADLIGKHNAYLYDVTIQAGADIIIPAASGATVLINHHFTVDGSVNITSGKTLRNSYAATAGGQLNVGVAGDILGSGNFFVDYPEAGEGFGSMDGRIRCAVFGMRYWRDAQELPAAIYESPEIQFYNSTFTTIITHAAGSTTFSGNVLYNVAGTGNITIANSTNDPTLVFQGDVTVTESSTGNLVWNEGTGGVQFTGGNNQSVGLAEAGTIEDVTVNKSGNTLTLSTTLTTESFIGTAGTFDPNGQTVTTTGACDWAAAFLFDSAADVMNGCSWVIGGNLTADGQTLNATAGWSLEVAGTAVASGVGDVAYCDANGAHTEIDASAGPWADGTNNTNWNFGVPSVPGMEFDLPANRMHFGLETNHLHFDLPANRMHFTALEDD